MRRCPKCGQTLPLDPDHFHRNRTRNSDSHGGYQHYCKPCQNDAVRRSVAKNPALYIEHRKRYRLRHRERRLAYEKVYRANNVAKLRADAHDYYVRNRVQVLASMKARRIARRIAAGLPPVGKPGRPPKYFDEG